MNTNNGSRFILHVSDFHLTENNVDYAKKILKKLVDKLSYEKVKVDYLIHTGDIINSSDAYIIVAKKLEIDEKFFIKEKSEIIFDKESFIKNVDKQQIKKFNFELNMLVNSRFKIAKEVFKEFISNLNIPLGNVIICSGNHDILQLLPITESKTTCDKEEEEKWVYISGNVPDNSFKPFENFLNELEIANSCSRCHSENSVTYCNVDNLNFLILNTNWENPYNQKKGYFCTRCDIVNNVLSEITITQNTFNIIVAHKPLYEICEKARLSYRRYIQTPFMSNLRKFIGKNGIYLCGDKHTRSIVGSKFHDIPHYIGGEPLEDTSNGEVEYNLLEINNNKLGMERKIHLKNGDFNQSNNLVNCECDICPQDDVVINLYELSKKYITERVFEIISISENHNSWESICQKIHDWEKIKGETWYSNFNVLYKTICKYRKFGYEEIKLDDDLFDFICNRIIFQMESDSKNVLNVRGEYRTGKSIFLGLFYIYLLNRYSIGKIDFIPAYFNLENREISDKIMNSSSYFEAVTEIFSSYVNSIQKTAVKEHQRICFIIDGLDEQDCWSYTTENSIGRAILDVLAQYDNSWYIMVFAQHRLPCLKNTMPARKYSDCSDIMYFNPIDIQENNSNDLRFKHFVSSYFKMQEESGALSKISNTDTINDKYIENICKTIQHFRRLTITTGFIYDNIEHIVKQNNTDNSNNCYYVSELYKYHIDKQYEICLNALGYNFIDYAPAMAYLFSYKGYTYERFKHIRDDNSIINSHIFREICSYYDKMYNTFLFIKKHKEAREYLIAIHYNRELRYYVEHPNEEIDSNSILNEFISRNIAVLIRKLWTDTNKFLIACENLLKREYLPACTMSMLVYCLAHLKMYTPIRDQLRKQIQEKGENFLYDKDNSNWEIKNGDSISKLEYFLNLSVKHSIEIFRLIDEGNSIQLVSALLSDKDFQKYNRQFQMLYYEDLSIKGEESKHPLNPGCDLVYKGFDFHNCFYYLYVKLISPHSYPLREFDMFTLWDLIKSRLIANSLETYKSNTDLETFFYRKNFKDRANTVLNSTLSIFNLYLDAACQNDRSSSIFKYFENVKKALKKILKLSDRNIESVTQILSEFDIECNSLFDAKK